MGVVYLNYTASKGEPLSGQMSCIWQENDPSWVDLFNRGPCGVLIHPRVVQA